MTELAKAAAVILAAGRGTRAGGSVPKQWRQLHGRPIVSHTLRAFQKHPDIGQIVLVLNENDMSRSELIVDASLSIVAGGDDRAHSVRNGLAAVTENAQVLIHDVARPLVTQATITAVIEALKSQAGAAPALAVTDALWTGRDGHVTGTQDRTGLYRAQTPQGFDLSVIRAAHAAHAGGAADDVEVARAYGASVAIVPGDEDNIKITRPEDFARAERIMRERNGY